MTEVELKLVANNKDAAQSIKELSQQTQKMYSEMGNNSKKAVGLIEKEEQVIKKLTEWKKKANADQIAQYNKEIELSRKRLDQYNKIGTEVQQTSQQVEKSGSSFINSIKGWALGFASVTAAIGFIKEGINSTEGSFEKFEQIMSLGKGAFQGFWSAVMAGDWAGLSDSIIKTAKATRDLTIAKQELEHITISEEIRKGYAERRLQSAREAAAETTDPTLRRQYYQEAIDAQKLVTEISVNLTKQRIGVAEEFFKSQIDANEKWKNYSIETFRTIAGQYNYLFATIDENGKKRDITGQEMAELTLKSLEDKKVLLGELSPLEENQRKELHNSVLAMKDFISVQDRMKPGQMDNYVKDIGALNNVLAEGSRSLVRLNTQLTRADSKDDTVQKKAADAYIKTEEEKLKLSQELIDKYDKSMIDSLSGVEKLEAQRKFGIKQIQEIRDQLLKLGELTPKQMAMLEGMAENVWKAYYEDIKKIAKNQEPELVTINTEIKVDEEKLKETQEKLALFPTSETLKNQVKSIEDHIKSLYKKREDIIINIKRIITTIEPGRAPSPGIPEIGGEVTPNDLVKLTQKRIDEIKKGSGSVPKSPSTIWDLMGINTETDEGKQIVDAAKNVASQLKGVMDDIMQRRTEDAQKRRELLDTQISEKQEELNRETDLLKKGYANEVDLRKKELDALKVQRDKAIQDEQKAVQQQRIIESTTQAISLATSIAQIFKANSKAGTIGVILAIASVAAMIAAFASAKSKVTNATKLAKGGTGTVEGLTHSEGGEKFLDHIEVEAGERWGVLSRGASQKYGNQFKDLVTAFNRDDKKMIFTTFNKLNPELAKRPVNILNVENSGPNKRLDKVNENLEKMNTKKEQVFHTDKAIIIVRGNHVTTIRR